MRNSVFIILLALLFTSFNSFAVEVDDLGQILSCYIGRQDQGALSTDGTRFIDDLSIVKQTDTSYLKTGAHCRENGFRINLQEMRDNNRQVAILEYSPEDNKEIVEDGVYKGCKRSVTRRDRVYVMIIPILKSGISSQKLEVEVRLFHTKSALNFFDKVGTFQSRSGAAELGYIPQVVVERIRTSGIVSPTYNWLMENLDKSNPVLGTRDLLAYGRIYSDLNFGSDPYTSLSTDIFSGHYGIVGISMECRIVR